MNKPYQIWVYDDHITVSQEVYRAYKRSLWREQKQEKAFDKRTVSYEWMKENGLEMQLKTRDAEEEMIKRLGREALNRALSALNKEERDLIYKIYYEGCSERAVAGAYGILGPAVHKRKKRILQKLKTMLSQELLCR